MYLLLIIFVIILALVLYLMTSNSQKTGGVEKAVDNREYEYGFMFSPIEKSAEKADELRAKLRKVGAVKRFETVMPIAVYAHPNGDPEDPEAPYIRVRHEGEKITFTVKTDRQAQFVKEYEVNVDKPGGKTVDEMHNMLTALQFRLRYRVEKLREIWDLKLKTGEMVEIVFDTYPGLPTYFEVETSSKKALDAATRLIGFDPKDEMGTSRDIYTRVYGFPKERKVPMGAELTFSSDTKKQFVGLFEKNEEMFDKLLKQQLVYVKQL